MTIIADNFQGGFKSGNLNFDQCKEIAKSLDINKNNIIDDNEMVFANNNKKSVTTTNDLAKDIYTNKISLQYLDKGIAEKIVNFFDKKKDGFITPNELRLPENKLPIATVVEKLVNGDLILNGSGISAVAEPNNPNKANGAKVAAGVAVGTAAVAAAGIFTLFKVLDKMP